MKTVSSFTFQVSRENRSWFLVVGYWLQKRKARSESGPLTNDHEPTTNNVQPVLRLYRFRLAAVFARQLDHSEVPLGGLSGAPVVVVTESAFHLVGIFIEGNQNLETGRAVPWDAVYSEYLDSLALPPPVAVT